jgi:hypothetical protein
MEWSTEEQTIAKQLTAVQRDMCRSVGVLPSRFLVQLQKRELERSTGVQHQWEAPHAPARPLVAALAQRLGLGPSAGKDAIRRELNRRAQTCGGMPLKADRIREVLELIERAEEVL